jgi:two-component system sensor histidine kinase ChiS
LPKVQKFFFYVMLAIMAVSIMVPLIRRASSKAPVAVKGILDLRNWRAEKGDTVKLNGEWEFYFGKLLTPADFKNRRPAGGTIQKVPAKWSSYKINGRKLPAHGAATYRLKILLPAKGGSYGLKITCISAAAKIFVNNRQILACGNPGNSPETTEHKYHADAAYFNTSKNQAEVLIQVANHIYANSGIYYEIHFGAQPSINGLRMYDFFIDTALIAGMFFISLYFFGLSLQRKSNTDVMFFAAFCLFSAIYDSTCSEAILNYAFPGLTYNASAKILVLSLILNRYSLFKYVYHAFKASYTRRTNLITDGIAAGLILLTCFTRFYLWDYAYLIFILGNIYVISLVLQIIFRYAHANIEGRYYLYTAIISSAVLLISSLCNIVLLMESNLFIPVFQPIFVLALALYMSEKYENSYQTIEKLSARLSAIDKLKDDFLAKTSHELKTPLNGITNISQSLLDGAGGSLNAGQLEDIRLITSLGKRLSTLVYDILDYSKLKTMDISLKINSIDVHPVVDSTADIFKYLIKGKPLRIENKIAPGACIVLADENRLKQIITNLLDNAVKFTPRGTITITGYCREEFGYIEVRDTGIGIPAGKLKDIFIAYEQLEPLSAEAMGAGLGLSITRQLVELQQGQIFAESEPGKGSCFTFSLPLGDRKKIEGPAPAQFDGYEPQNAPLTEINLPYTADVGGQFSILAVDDEYSNLKALLNILTVCQYNVTLAGDAESALGLLAGVLKYDLCILDVMMPGMSGYEACRKIRETYSPLELPVLLLTAKALPEDLEAGFMAGANDFVAKPFEASELKCRVQTLVQLKESKDLLLEKETAFLQAQIRPHFLYNALNTINSFCYTNPVKAGELLAELGVFLRNSFDFSSTAALIPIEQELRLIKAYVAIEKARFGDRLAVEYHIDPAVLPYGILPLTIQPIVENSIRHGLMQRNRGGKVILEVTFREERIAVRVSDNGTGIPAHILDGLTHAKLESQGVGLTNIERRILKFYGAALNISSAEGCGTTVSFCIPAKLL